MQNDSFIIARQKITPGKTHSIDLPISKMYTHTELTMPIRVISSKEKGPRLFISAAIHGDEINGVEIIRRLLKVLSPEKIKGTLIVVPVVNIHGFLDGSRYLPDRRDLNRNFPGSGKGSLASRLASIFISEIVENSTHGIDLHTAAIHRINLPQIRIYLKDKKSKDMAKAFSAPVILDSVSVEGSLRAEMFKRKTPYLLYEAGEALRFNEVCIRGGVNGILSVMHYLKMLKRKPNVKEISPYIARSSQWIRAPQSGLFRGKKTLGARVNQNDVLGYISDSFGKQQVQIKSKIEGIVIGKTQLPLVNEGDALYHIATFKKINSVENVVTFFQDELGEEAIHKNANL